MNESLMIRDFVYMEHYSVEKLLLSQIFLYVSSANRRAMVNDS